MSNIICFIFMSDLSRTFGKLFIGLSLALGTLKQQKSASTGLAWQVRGTWQVEGKGAPLRNGDPIEPSSLLEANGDLTQGHSIVILLPDGQHTFYECFKEEDCARGFRVPALNRRPAALEADLLARFRTAMDRRRGLASGADPADRSGQLSRDEAVAMLDAAGHVRIAGRLVASLPPGRYGCDLHSVRPADQPQVHLVLNKTESSIELPVSGRGLYVATITDAMSTPRLELLFAAIGPEQKAAFASFDQAKEVLAKWNSEYFGWPVHDILRAYLESLAETTQPATR